MKTTNTNTMNLDCQIKELSKRDLMLIKFTIGLFGVVLNVCCLQLFF